MIFELKKTYSWGIYLVFLLVVLVSVGEMMVRHLYGEELAGESNRSVLTSPSPFFIPNELYGYSMAPGKFHISQNETVNWVSTQGTNGYRTTSDTVSVRKDEIWIFGCSFSYGWGIDDQYTYPYLLQQMFPNLLIRNFSVGGYGTLHALIQLKEQLKLSGPPEKLIIPYGSFHNIRNTGSPLHLKVFQRVQQMKVFTYPFAYLENDSIIVGYKDLDYHEYPFSKQLYLVRFVQLRFEEYVDRKLNNYAVTKSILNEIMTICKNHDIQLILAGISDSKETSNMLNEFSSKDVVTLDMSVNLSLPEYRVPHDGHPNEKAHQHYADVLSNYLIE